MKEKNILVCGGRMTFGNYFKQKPSDNDRQGIIEYLSHTLMVLEQIKSSLENQRQDSLEAKQNYKKIAAVALAIATLIVAAAILTGTWPAVVVVLSFTLFVGLLGATLLAIEQGIEATEKIDSLEKDLDPINQEITEAKTLRSVAEDCVQSNITKFFITKYDPNLEEFRSAVSVPKP